MSITGENLKRSSEADKSRRTVFLVAGLIAILGIGLLVFYLVSRRPPVDRTVGRDAPNENLEGALRAGSPDFEKYRSSIILSKPVADYADTFAGGIQVTLMANVINNTGRTINGLELKGSIIDAKGKVIKERTKIVVPSGAVEELENGQVVRAPIPIPGFTEEYRQILDEGQARLEMVVTGIKFK